MPPPPPSFPRPPEKPDPLECCNRGCCPCIFDYYYDALSRWEELVRKLGGDPADELRKIQVAAPRL